MVTVAPGLIVHFLVDGLSANVAGIMHSVIVARLELPHPRASAASGISCGARRRALAFAHSLRQVIRLVL